MTSPVVARMRKRTLVLLVLTLGVVAGALWWWREHRATKVLAPGSGSAGTRTGSVAPDEQHAHVTVVVSDPKGLLANATVRLGLAGGDVSVARPRSRPAAADADA